MRICLQPFLLVTVGVILFWGCKDKESGYGLHKEAYVPIYSQDPNIKKITFQPAQTPVQTGKLFTAFPGYLLEEEVGQGLHVINCKDPAHPKRTGFIKVPGMGTAYIKDKLLYVENYEDLVVVALNDLQSVSEVSRINHVRNENPYPPYTDIYFVCPDPAKGTVTGWEKKIVDNPKCSR